ncbi:MAG: sulfur oxidation c-type cytochrome SoxX [Methylosarcina sp.]
MKLFLILTAAFLFACASSSELTKQRLSEGKRIAFDRNQGNCLACHRIEDGEDPGNIGPQLTAVTSRFETKQQLYDQIFDATRFNPETSMPPFGKNNILSQEDIDKIVDYLWSLP